MRELIFQATAIILIIVVLIFTSRNTFEDLRIFSYALNHVVEEPQINNINIPENTTKEISEKPQTEPIKKEEIVKPKEIKSEKEVKTESVKKDKPNKIDAAAYIKRAERKITANWTPPEMYGNQRYKIKLTINKGGYVWSYKILENSGIPAFNDSANEAVNFSEPFGPLPEGYDFLDMTYTFETKKNSQTTQNSNTANYISRDYVINVPFNSDAEKQRNYFKVQSIINSHANCSIYDGNKEAGTNRPLVDALCSMISSDKVETIVKELENRGYEVYVTYGLMSN